MSKGKAPSQRQLRVGELVRHALTEVLTRETLDDPALDGQLISVSEVRMSPDLKIATCFISPLGARTMNGTGYSDSKTICKALAGKAKFIRGRVAPLLRQMKYMPTFRFLEDTSFENFAKIDALLRSDKVRRDTDRQNNDPEGK